MDTEEQSVEHNNKVNYAVCARHSKLLEEMHTALCGKPEFKIKGVVQKVEDLEEGQRNMKNWRNRLEIKVAGISGGVATAVLLFKHFWSNTKG